VVFCNFVGSVGAILRRLSEKGIESVGFTGSTGPRDRQLAMEYSERTPKSRVLVATRVYDEGVNMQFANHVLLASPWWNSKKDEQAISRLHRLGQKRNVFATWLTMASSSKFASRPEGRKMVSVCMRKLRAVKEIRPFD